MDNKSIALKEFNQITKNQKIQIPEDIENVKNNLNRLGGLLTASEWARSAIVRAWVEPKKRGRPLINGEDSSFMDISGFTQLGIQGLSTRDAVRHYYNAWGSTKLPDFIISSKKIYSQIFHGERFDGPISNGYHRPPLAYSENPKTGSGMPLFCYVNPFNAFLRGL